MQQSKIVKDLFRSKHPHAILYKLKELDYESSSKKIKQALKHPFSKRLLFDNGCLPKKYSELRKGKQLYFSNNLAGELAWLVNSLSKYTEEINLFIDLEKKYQTSILLGEFETAKEILDKINSDICVSYWAIENIFSVEQKLNGTEANWSFLKELNNKTNLPYTNFFSSFFSVKSEAEVSILQYKRSIENFTKVDLPEHDIEYVIYRLGYFYEFIEFKEYAYFLYAETISSVIDKYLLLIDVLTDLSDDNANKNLLKSVIEELNHYGIIDSRLDRLKEINYGDSLLNLNTEILNLFDIYTIGDHQGSIKMSIDLLKKYPYALEVYETLIKSYIEEGKGFFKTNISFPIDFILEKMYSIFNKDENFYESKESLLREYIYFPKLSFFKQLLALILSCTRKKYIKADATLYLINSNFSNPQIIFGNDVHSRIDFEEFYFKTHISIRVNKYILDKNYEGLRNENLPTHKLKIYEARIGYRYDDETNIELLNELANNLALNNYFYEENILSLFKANQVHLNIEILIKLVVDSYFKNNFLIERLNIEDLINHIVTTNYVLENVTIDLPILFFIHETDAYFLFVTLEIFLNTISVDKPSEIENYHNEYAKSRFIYLLDKVCTVDVLNNFYLLYENDDEVIQERIQILKKLAKIDDINQKKYIEEIASLTQKKTIRRVINQVNDGKISLNFSRIAQDKKLSIENSFNRFLKLKGFSEKNELLVMDSQDLISSYFSNNNDESEKRQDASFINFKSLFFEITDHFLFSEEHGLEGDLSTRIRHGVLENELRSIFKSLDLISTKKSENEYNNINVWDTLCDNIAVRQEVKDGIQMAFKDFSKSIDSLILSIIKSYIQIQSNSHTDKVYGLFNYRFIDEYLQMMYKEVSSTIDNHEDFIHYAFNILTVITNTSLKNVRNFLEKDINTKFQSLINNLESDIKKVIDKGEIFSEINRSINISRTQIQKKIYSISNWFKITNINSGALDMDTIIKTAFESINLRQFENEKIVPKIKAPQALFFAGGFYYIDIFKILIDNSIEYSNLPFDKLNIEIEIINEVLHNKEKKINESFSRVVIKFKNDIAANSRDVNKIKDKLDNVVSSWKSDLSRVNIEGGSGFQKINRMLNYDIKALESIFSFKLENNSIVITLEIINEYNLLDD